MRRVLTSTSAALATFGLLLATSIPAFAQSGSRNNPPRRSARRAARGPTALEGYCPVSILEMHKWVKGDPDHQVVYDGRTYLFASKQGKNMFQEHPAKYVPALGGDCVVALVEMGKRVPGNIRHAAFHDQRLFLFSNETAQKMFLANPSAYADADLAYGGKCVVCQVAMGKTVPGKADFAVFHDGLRYLFPSADQRRQFLATPQKYTVPANNPARPPSGSTTRRQPAAGSGTR